MKHGGGTGKGGAQARKDWAGWGARARNDRVGGSPTGALCTRFTLIFNNVKES